MRLGLLALLAGVGACGDPSAQDCTSGTDQPPGSAAALGDDVLATVNGAPIRAGELQFALARKNRNKDRELDPGQAKAKLEELVELEIARQAAVGAGFDTDAEYLKKLRFYEAPFVQFQREELAALYVRREVTEKGRPDDAEVREYFETHAAELKSQFHLMQIIVRKDEAKIRELKKQLDDGVPFEEVVATLYPEKLPEGVRAPWDLGYMRWSHVPAVWREALVGMKDGDVSDVLAGPKGRFWIVKLVERRASDEVTFEQVRPELVKLLQAERAEGLGEKATAELRRKAEIVYVRDPGSITPPDENDE